jgi:putative DNA primase/helicase
MIPRRTVFVGTVNPEDGGYLRDPTGARRFWPLECNEIDLPGILSDRNQIWAEAVHHYRNGAEWHLVDDEVETAREEQEKRREIHPWETAIRAYAAARVIDEITVVEALTDAIKVPLDKQTPQLGRQVGGILRGMGWLPDPTRRVHGIPTKVFVRRISDEERRRRELSFEDAAFGDDAPK